MKKISYLINIVILFFLSADLIKAQSDKIKVQKREFGLGLRSGVTQTAATFGKGEELYVGSSTEVNALYQNRFPLFIQADENLISNWIYTLWYIDFSSVENLDLPPRDPNYEDLITTNTENELGKKFIINSSQTNISRFYERFPEYQSIIDEKSNPTLSADFNHTSINFGKSYGIFYAPYENHRFVSLGLGLGLGYVFGSFSINVCDPYLISDEIKELDGGQGEVRVGVCKNKTNLFKQNISSIVPTLNLILKGYTYTGSRFEINILEWDIFFNRDIFNQNKNQILEPTFASSYVNFASLVYKL